MNDILSAIISAAQATSQWEIIAFAFGIAYLLLAIKQNPLCWYAGFINTGILAWLFWDASLVMESALNIYYLLIAIYGWWAWRHGNAEATQELAIQRWQLPQHLIAAVAIVGLTLLSGSLLAANTDAAVPFFDSFTTWGAVITTWMVTRKVLENWLYWQLFNSCAIYLYWQAELYLIAVQMAIYLGLAIVGWFKWKKDYEHQLN
ncbi:nicotinamide riboside transporter PnuC [Bacterioplanoides sp.]|uniref:nicotinamide riboside transporter PnuC n=1 Tax=Bacterioplanoides sp. TaxID=2066072 RepID=UPI003B002C91